MLTRVPEAIRNAEKALDFADLASQEPLKFQFYYEQGGKAEISNTIYLEDGNPSLTLYLEVFNDSEDVIKFQKPNSVGGRLATVAEGGVQAASAKKCHFQLRWENDLGLKPDEIEMEASGEWQVNYDYDDDRRFFSIYFLHKSGLALNPSGKIKLGFKKLTANNRTVKSSNVELLYGGKGLVLQGQSQEAIENEISSRIAVSVINYPGKTKIPLQFRVLGSNKILNDGTTKNSLTLKILNSPLSSNARKMLLLDKNSQFIVSFEKGDHTDALVTANDQLTSVRIDVTGSNSNLWTSSHQINSTEWGFTPKADIKQLAPGQGIELTITNLVTNSASGFACIYIDYQNIGSYPDGRLVIPIEKTPLLYSGDKVAVGTKNFDSGEDAKLTVAGGDIVLGNDKENEKFILHSRKKYKGDFLQITHDKTDGQWAWEQGITLQRGGNVGIGTSRPQAKLHVNGGDALITGKVGIGTNSPEAKLHVNDGDALISGKVGIGTNSPAAKLPVNGGDAVISGKVGIGTENPKAKLPVNGGDAVFGGKATFSSNVGIGTTPPDTGDYWTRVLDILGSTNAKLSLRTTKIDGRFQVNETNCWALRVGDTGWSQMAPAGMLVGTDTDHALNFGTNSQTRMTISSDGNVGIGTATPRASLDVSASVKLGPHGTIVQRMICGQVFYNTKEKRWQYSVFSESGDAKVEFNTIKSMFTLGFKIYYGFSVRDTQELVILATVLDQYADNTVCVKEIYEGYCVLLIKNVKSQNVEPTNFSFMIIHCGLPHSQRYFSNVGGEKGSLLIHGDPIDNYFPNR